MGEIIRGYLVPHPPIIVSEVGGESRKAVQKTIRSMERMADEVAELNPDTVVITTPHGQSFRDFFYLPDGDTFEGSFAAFGAPDPHLVFSHNQALMRKLEEACRQAGFFAGFLSAREKRQFSVHNRLDHGALVPLYFLSKTLSNINILYLPTPYLDLEQMMRFGEILGRVIRESSFRTVFIASGDLSHCLKESAPAGYNPAGQRYDARIRRIVETMDEEELLSIAAQEMQEAAECGTRSFATLWGAMHERRLQSEIYSYEGTFGVGYLVAAIRPQEENRDA